MICFYMQVFVLYGYSLTVQYLFPLPQHSGLKEGIYRGSMRLEHSVNTNKVLKNTDRAGETKAAEPSSGMFFFFFYGLSLSIID